MSGKVLQRQRYCNFYLAVRAVFNPKTVGFPIEELNSLYNICKSDTGGSAAWYGSHRNQTVLNGEQLFRRYGSSLAVYSKAEDALT